MTTEKDDGIRHREFDVGRVSGGGRGQRQGPAIPDRVYLREIADGGVRRSIADLRAESELARANAPTSTRYIAWGLAIASGQPISEIERLTLRQVPYFVDFLKNKKVPY
jgi:hypothetical protein